MSAVGRTFSALRQRVQAVELKCASLEADKAPASVVPSVTAQGEELAHLQAELEALRLAMADIAVPEIPPGPAVFTFRSGDLTFHGVPANISVSRINTGRYLVTNLEPGMSYLVEPPRFLALGNECNDGALCLVVVWAPTMTADSFEIRFMYNGGLYDGNYGGSSPNDFLTFALYPRSTLPI